MWTLIFSVTTAAFAVGWLKWKILALVLAYYIEKSQCKLPTDEEIKECTGFVTKNMNKELTTWLGEKNGIKNE